MQKILTALALLAASLPALATQGAALLVYRVWEEGSEPYTNRILVTPDYVRMDEGEGSGDGFTLLDRHAGIIYNVSDEDHSVLVMEPPEALPPAPMELELSVDRQTDPEAPRVGGRAPAHLVLRANGKTCRELDVVPGLMPAAVAGLKDFRRVLSRVQGATLKALPPETQGPCELSENVYAPLRELDYGLPIQERGEGRSQSLVDFDPDHPADAALFEVPGDYRRLRMPGL